MRAGITTMGFMISTITARKAPENPLLNPVIEPQAALRHHATIQNRQEASVMQFTIYHKLGFAFLITAWLVGGVNLIGNILIPEPPMQSHAMKAEKPAEKPAETSAPAQKAAEKKMEPAPAPTPAPPSGASSGIGALLAAADIGAGQKAFKKCKSCHSADKGGKNKVGPNLWDIVGNAKASKQGYKYSGALKGLGGEWTYNDLDGFLANPRGFAKGTKMSFSGVKKEGQRATLIVYLRSLSDQPKPLP